MFPGMPTSFPLPGRARRRARVRIAAGLTAAALALVAGRAPEIQGPRQRGPLTTGEFALVHVTAISMTRARVIPDATVLVKDGRIAWIGKGPGPRRGAGVRVIDGTGKYLIPGLADMHTHLFSDAEAVDDSAGPAELGVMLANGVTTARLMIGTPAHLVLRARVAEGSVLGPKLWVAGPQVAGRPDQHTLVATTDSAARAAVRTVRAAGYDFVKLTNFITPAVYEAVIDEARKAGIRVVGHVDPAVGIQRALQTGEQLEHLDSFFEAVLADSSPIRESVTQYGVFRNPNWASLDHIDDRKIDRLAGQVARAGAVIGPTQNVFNTAFAIGETDSAVRNRPDWTMWPVALREGYLRAKARYWNAEGVAAKTEARRQRYVEVRNRLVRAIHDSGGKIMAGSDTPEWFHTYGWGLHRELEALVAAGLTPYEALEAATVVPAEFLGRSDFGTLAAGKRADLVLLSANPLDQIRNTNTIEAVIFGGRWLDRSTLDAMLARGPQAIHPRP